MKVLKFGGTSVGSAQRMKDVAKLITDGEKKIVVLSAMSGTTNTLVEISDYLYKKNPEGANEIINNLETAYRKHVDELYSTDEYKQKTLAFLKDEFNFIRSYTKDLFTLFEEKIILAQGEIISTNMMTNYLLEQGINAVLIPALDYMRTDKNAEPDLNYIKEKLAQQLAKLPEADIYITQGYICRNAYGEVDNLQRGGSDYTASLIGAAVNASEIQIWTDIDGMHDNDPRVVDKTAPVRQLQFEEAAELAYFGAKILHPTCIQPEYGRSRDVEITLRTGSFRDIPGIQRRSALPLRSVRVIFLRKPAAQPVVLISYGGERKRPVVSYFRSFVRHVGTGITVEFHHIDVRRKLRREVDVGSYPVIIEVHCFAAQRPVKEGIPVP